MEKCTHFLISTKDTLCNYDTLHSVSRHEFHLAISLLQRRRLENGKLNSCEGINILIYKPTQKKGNVTKFIQYMDLDRHR